MPHNAPAKLPDAATAASGAAERSCNAAKQPREPWPRAEPCRRQFDPLWARRRSGRVYLDAMDFGIFVYVCLIHVLFAMSFFVTNFGMDFR